MWIGSLSSNLCQSCQWTNLKNQPTRDAIMTKTGCRLTLPVFWTTCILCCYSPMAEIRSHTYRHRGPSLFLLAQKIVACYMPVIIRVTYSSHRRSCIGCSSRSTSRVWLCYWCAWNSPRYLYDSRWPHTQGVCRDISVGNLALAYLYPSLDRRCCLRSRSSLCNTLSNIAHRCKNVLHN